MACFRGMGWAAQPWKGPRRRGRRPALTGRHATCALARSQHVRAAFPPRWRIGRACESATGSVEGQLSQRRPTGLSPRTISEPVGQHGPRRRSYPRRPCGSTLPSGRFSGGGHSPELDISDGDPGGAQLPIGGAVWRASPRFRTDDGEALDRPPAQASNPRRSRGRSGPPAGSRSRVRSPPPAWSGSIVNVTSAACAVRLLSRGMSRISQ
jgi:hypothetical protein